MKIKITSSLREMTSSRKGTVEKVGFDLGPEAQVGAHERVKKIGQGNTHTYLRGKLQTQAIKTNLSTIILKEMQNENKWCFGGAGRGPSVRCCASTERCSLPGGQSKQHSSRDKRGHALSQSFHF